MLNDAQKQALEEEFNKSEYTELVQSGRAIDLTDYLNAPRLLVTDNPEEQGTVTIVPSVSDLFVPAAEGGDPIIPYAEQGELRIGMWDDLVVSVGVGEATVRIDNVLRLNGTEAPRIYKVGELLIEHAPALLPAFLGLLAADGWTKRFRSGNTETSCTERQQCPRKKLKHGNPVQSRHHVTPPH